MLRGPDQSFAKCAAAADAALKAGNIVVWNYDDPKNSGKRFVLNAAQLLQVCNDIMGSRAILEHVKTSVHNFFKENVFAGSDKDGKAKEQRTFFRGRSFLQKLHLPCYRELKKLFEDVGIECVQQVPTSLWCKAGDTQNNKSGKAAQFFNYTSNLHKNRKYLPKDGVRKADETGATQVSVISCID